MVMISCFGAATSTTASTWATNSCGISWQNRTGSRCRRAINFSSAKRTAKLSKTTWKRRYSSLRPTSTTFSRTFMIPARSAAHRRGRTASWSRGGSLETRSGMSLVLSTMGGRKFRAPIIDRSARWFKQTFTSPMRNGAKRPWIVFWPQWDRPMGVWSFPVTIRRRCMSPICIARWWMRWPSLEIFCWSGKASIDWLPVHWIDWLIECPTVWLIGRLIDWLSAWLIVCLISRLIAWLIDELFDWLIDWLIDWSVEIGEVFSPGFTGTAAFTYASHFRLAKVPWMPCDTAERKSWVVQYTWIFAYRTGERCWIKWSVCARTRRWLYRTPEHHSCWTKIGFPCTFRSAIHRRPAWMVRGDVCAFFIN